MKYHPNFIEHYKGFSIYKDEKEDTYYSNIGNANTIENMRCHIDAYHDKDNPVNRPAAEFPDRNGDY